MSCLILKHPSIITHQNFGNFGNNIYLLSQKCQKLFEWLLPFQLFRARAWAASPGGHATQREKSGIRLNDHMSRMKTNRCWNVTSTHHTWHWHIMSLYDLFIEDFERQHWKIEKTVKTRLGPKRSNLIKEYILDFFLSHVVVGKISSIIFTRSFYI